jgi:hypothetical protein
MRSELGNRLQRFTMMEQQKRAESDAIVAQLEALSAKKRPHASISVGVNLLKHRIAILESKAADRRLANERGTP